MQNPVELTFSIKDIINQIFQFLDLEWSNIESSLMVSKLFFETINWTLFQKYKQNNPDDTEIKSEFFLKRLFKISKHASLIDGVFEGFYTIKEAEDCFLFLGKNSLKNTGISFENCTIFLKLTHLKALKEKGSQWNGILENRFVRNELYNSAITLLLQHILQENPDEILSQNTSLVITECHKYGGFRYPLKKIFHDPKYLSQLKEIELSRLLALCTYQEAYIRQILDKFTAEQINTINYKIILTRGYDLFLIILHSEKNIVFLDLSAKKISKMLCCINELINNMISESFQKTGVGHPFTDELKNWLSIFNDNKKVKALALPKRLEEWMKQIQKQPIFSAIMQLQLHNNISCLRDRYSIRNNPICLSSLFEEFLKINDLENKSAKELLMVLKNTEEQLREILEMLDLKKLLEKTGFFYDLGCRRIAEFIRYQHYIKKIKDCLESLYPLEEDVLCSNKLNFSRN